MALYEYYFQTISISFKNQFEISLTVLQASENDAENTFARAALFRRSQSKNNVLIVPENPQRLRPFTGGKIALGLQVHVRHLLDGVPLPGEEDARVAMVLRIVHRQADGLKFARLERVASGSPRPGGRVAAVVNGEVGQMAFGHLALEKGAPTGQVLLEFVDGLKVKNAMK